MEHIFAALGDPVRRRMLELVADEERAVGAIVESLQSTMAISQPAVSQHLKVLRDAGLVTARSDGTRRLHMLEPKGIEMAQSWLAGLTDASIPFDQSLDALETEVARGRRTRRMDADEAEVVESDDGTEQTA